MFTIITKPISPVYNFLKWGRNILLKIQGCPIPNEKYGGHFAVTRSAVEGLKKIKVDFNYNPSKISELSKVVYVPGGLQALKWAIKMKRRGKIKKLIAGPNQVITPDDNNGIIKSKYIDLFLVNSQWIKDFYTETAPELSDHIDIWPAGVDTEFWKPNKLSGIEKNVLLYYKRPIKKMFEACKKILEDAGYKVEIITYGKYTVDQYKESLNRNSFLVHFVEQESQGISLAEAWSMDTPTLVWDPGYYYFNSTNSQFCSSSPYLTEQTGLSFKNSAEFNDLINKSLTNNIFSPRIWTLNNMSDEVCSKKLSIILKKYESIN